MEKLPKEVTAKLMPNGAGRPALQQALSREYREGNISEVDMSFKSLKKDICCGQSLRSKEKSSSD